MQCGDDDSRSMKINVKVASVKVVMMYVRQDVRMIINILVR